MQIMEPFIQKILCPYCNTEIELRKCKIVSGKDRTTVLFEPKPLTLFPQSIVGRSMTRELAARQCTKCNELLPRNFESVDRNIPIAIIGDTLSGKSHYIAALIEQLRSGKFAPAGHELWLNAADTEVEEIYQRDYYQPLFKHNLKLERNAKFFDLDAKPLIYELTIEGQTRKVVNLLIYDISGEDIADVRDLVRYRPHLLNARGILFMAYPWAIPGFSKKLAHHLRPRDGQVTGRVATSLLHPIIELFRDYTDQGRKTHFKTPTALVIAKADLIPFLNIDPYYQDLFNPDFADRLDIDNDSPINQIIQQLLHNLNESGLVNLAKQLEYTRFFVTSATGSNLDESTDTFPFIRPYRCLDPLFWLLHEIGVLD